MVRSVAVLGLVVATLCASAAADPRDRVMIDKIDVQPSPLHGLARVRALVSATTLQGERIPEAGKPSLTAKIGGERTPAVLGYAALAEAELNLVIVVATTDAFRDHLDRVREAIDEGLLQPLEKLGTSRVRVGVIGYGERTIGQKSVGTIASARAALGRLTVDDVTPEVALVAAIGEATTLATKTKAKVPGALLRTVVVIVSDGDGVAKEKRGDVTKAGVDAGKKGVRIHALGFSPTQARRPLLNLGELSKQSGGTFRWVQTPEGFTTATRQLVDQLARQYVLTAFVAPADVEGKKLVVAIDNASGSLTTDGLKLPEPTCNKELCDAGSYCVHGECVRHKRRPKGGLLRWLLYALGGVVGVVGLGVGARAVARRQPRPAMPAPGGAPVVAGVPAPVAAPAAAIAPGTPVLIAMSGPDVGRQIPVHHGLTLGKAPDNHVSLAHDGTASGHHANLTFDGQAWTLTDLGSTNGTFANGNRIVQVRLFPGMTLRLGSTEYRFWQA